MPRWWLAIGLFAGLAMASKYTAALLWFGIVLWLLLTPVDARLAAASGALARRGAGDGGVPAERAVERQSRVDQLRCGKAGESMTGSRQMRHASWPSLLPASSAW